MLVDKSQIAATLFVFLLVAMTLAIDAITPRGVAIGVLYVLPLLLFIRLAGGAYALRLFLALALLCLVLIWAGFVVSPPNYPPLSLEIRLANRVLSSSLIMIVTLMSLQAIDPHAMHDRYNETTPYAFTESILLIKSVEFMTQLRATLTPTLVAFVGLLAAALVAVLKVAGLLQETFADGVRSVLMVDYTVLAALVLLMAASGIVRVLVGLLRRDKHFWRDLVDLAGWLMVHGPFYFVMVFFAILASNVATLVMPAAGTWMLVFSFFLVLVIEVHELSKYALGAKGTLALLKRMAGASKVAHALLSQSVKAATESLTEEEKKEEPPEG